MQVALLAYVLRTTGARFELQSLAARVLVELTTANCAPPGGLEHRELCTGFLTKIPILI